jgi:hypothetical protein
MRTIKPSEKSASARRPLPQGEAIPLCEAASRLHGTWKMVSWQTEDLASGHTSDALGPDPEGYITYTPDGRVMVLVLKAERKRPTALVPSNEEKIALYDSMFAYAGTFTADAEKVVHHIDMSWNEAWTGTAQIRFHKIERDQLTYISAPAKSPLSGRECVHIVRFRRVQHGSES